MCISVRHKWPSTRLPVQDTTDRHPTCKHGCIASVSRARRPKQALHDLTEAEQKFSQAAYSKIRARPPKLASISLQHEAGAHKCSFLNPEEKPIHAQAPDDVWHRPAASRSIHILSDNSKLVDQQRASQPPPTCLATLFAEHTHNGMFNCWPQHPGGQQSNQSAHRKDRPYPASQRIPKYAWSSEDESADETDPQQSGTDHAMSVQEEQHSACPGPDEAQLRRRINNAWQGTGRKHYRPPHAQPAAQRRPPDTRALRLRIRRLSLAMHLDDTDDSEDESQTCDDFTDPAWPAPTVMTHFRSTGSLLGGSAGSARSPLIAVCHD